MGRRTYFRLLNKRLLGWSLLASLAACDLGFEESPGGDGGGDGGGSDAAFVYQGAGPFWHLEIDEDDDFELDIRPRPGGTLRTTVRGTFEELSSGYSRLQVTGATGEDQPSSNTSLAALALTDDFLLVQDWGQNRRLVPFVAGDNCRQTDFSANWVQWITPSGSLANSNDNAFFGSLRLRPNDEEAEFTTNFALTEDFPEQDAPDPFDIGSCSSGVARNGDHQTFFGEGGTALIHRNIGTSQESLVLALPPRPIANADLDGRYRGFWIDMSRGVTDRVWYVTLECASGECVAQRINDIANLNSLTNDGFRIDLDMDALDEPETGFVTGSTRVTISAVESYSGSIGCMASDDFNGSGEKILVCVGQSPRNPQLTVNGFFVANE